MLLEVVPGDRFDGHLHATSRWALCGAVPAAPPLQCPCGNVPAALPSTRLSAEALGPRRTYTADLKDEIQ